MPDHITIKDIARALQLSFSTVSRALDGNPRISEATTLRVREYAAAHQYRPNLNAKSLRNKKNRSIGVMLSSVPNSFFAEVINGIDSVAAAKDYHIIVTQSHESAEKELGNLEHLLWRSVDGLLVSLSSETEDLTAFKKVRDEGKPLIFFDRIPQGMQTHTVSADNMGAAFKATQYLIACGYQRIAHITSAAKLSITKERLEGYRQALAAANIAYDENYVWHCQHGGMVAEEVREAMAKLQALQNLPDALLTLSDRITLESLSWIKKHGTAFPTEIAVVGFSNFAYPELFTPPLTTLRQPAFDMGKVAAELLIQQIEAKRPVKFFENRVLPVELVVREPA